VVTCICSSCRGQPKVVRFRRTKFGRATTLLALPGDRDSVLAVELRRIKARDGRLNMEERRALSNAWFCIELSSKYRRSWKCSYKEPCCYCEENAS
jgi:hypothetical protein